MKKQILNWVGAILILASLIANFALYSRAIRAEETNDDLTRISNQVNQAWQTRLDSALTVIKEKRAITKTETNNIVNRTNHDKKDIRKQDSIVRNIPVNKLDSLWKITGIDKMP